MNIFVTGAAGFIAYHLIEKLLTDGHKVVGVDNFISGQKKNIELLSKHKNFIFFELDIINLTLENKNLAIEPYLKNIDEIFHLACPASPPIYQKNSLHTLDTCYMGSKNILEIAKLNKAKILLASTSEIYGDPLLHPQPESYRGNTNSFGPRACYDEGKRIMETLAYSYFELGVQIRIVRIFNTYGPKMAAYDGRVLTNFISQAIKNEPLTVYGDGSQTRSFCFIDDLVNGIFALMNSNLTIPVNLGSQFEFSILDIAKTVIRLVNPTLKIIFAPLPIDDPKQRCPDTTLASKSLNWHADTALENGLKKMIEFMKLENKSS